MATPNRATVFAKAHKILKKYYKPVEPGERSVLDHMLFACLLENAHYAVAEQAFETLKTGFFDWNEVRVSTVKEIAEAIAMHPSADSSASNLRRVLFSVFESTYSFDLELLKKMTLGQAQQRLEKIDGSTPFVRGYVTQTVLGGHCIPLDRGAITCLQVIVGLAEKEVKESSVIGLERAIPKNKGIEFGSLLHQLGADLMENAFSQGLHKTLLEIAPDAKERLPQKRTKPKVEAKPIAAPAKSAKDDKGKSAPLKKPEPVKPAAPAKPVVPAKAVVKKEPPKKDKPALAKKPAAPAAKRKPK